jgi:hypothetical protein
LVKPASFAGAGRDGGDGRARVVGAGGDYLRFCQRGPLAQVACHGAEHGAARRDPGEKRRAQAEGSDEFFRPAARGGIIKLRRAGERLLGHFHPRKPRVEVIGDVEEMIGTRQDPGIFLLLRFQMEERIDGHELDSRLRVDFGEGNFLKQAGRTFRRPAIAIAVRFSDLFSRGIEQDIIDAPGIGADSGDGQPALRGLFQAGKNLLVEVGKVPVQVVSRRHDPVGEAMDFLQRETSALERAQHKAAAFGSQVDGKVISCAHEDEVGLV